MANPPPPTPDGIADDFFEQIFSMPPYGGSMAGGEAGMALQLGSGEGSAGMGGGGGFPPGAMFPLGLSLEQGKGGFSKAEEGSGSGKRPREEAEGTTSNKADRDPIQLGSLFPTFGHQFRPNPPPQVFHGQGTHGGASAAPQPPAPRPRLRRERIAERLRALQELVPHTNMTDRAAMLDEILDYVKFLKLQVRVLSMSRLGGTGAVAQLVADIPLSSHEGETRDGGSEQQVWEKWSTDGTERQVAKLMDEDVGAAMQFLQTKALCMMPISLATAIYDTHNQSDPPAIKPEPNTPS